MQKILPVRFKGENESDKTADRRYKKLKRLAKKYNVSMAEVVRQSVDNFTKVTEEYESYSK